MKAPRFFFGFVILVWATGIGMGMSGQKKKKPAKAPIPIYVTPYYDSEGIKIDVGKFSQTLAKADSKSILGVIAEMQKQREKLRAEVAYVAAIRLYDLGHKDEAVYWFYTAQYRAGVFRSILDRQKMGGIGAPAFELRQAYAAFNQLAGEYINGYAFGELDKLEKTLAKVREEGKAIPKYTVLYPRVKFIDSKTWQETNAKYADGNITGMIQYIRKNAALIKELRKKNGLDGKY
ncbi:MAG: hypothetical protein HYX68_02615 [Planctomycetes bacterium]|nr:hypothetical protein [Planctomycetota bacterium]